MKANRTYHQLMPTEMTKKPLRFSIFLSEGNRTLGNLLKNNKGHEYLGLYTVRDFSFPIILNTSLVDIDGNSPFLDTVIEHLKVNLKLERVSDRLSITGIDCKRKHPWASRQFIEPSSFADILLEILSCDPLFDERSLTKILRIISPAIQRGVESMISLRFPEVTKECLKVMRTK